MVLNSILNTDCIKGMSALPDNSIDLIIVDPPYGIAKKSPLNGNSHGKIKTLHADWDIFSSFDEFLNFNRLWIEQSFRLLKPNGSIAVWGDRRNIFFVQPILEQFFPKFLDLITWIKRDAPPNITQRGLAASTEFCLIYCKNSTNWTFNGNALKKYNNDKQMRNFLDITRTMSSKERVGHPTQKKIETHLILVEMLSNKEEIVLDPFLGSGTTACACIIRQKLYWF